MDERVAHVLAEGPPPLNGFLQRVLDFVQALRRAGVGPTQSEAIDAVRTLPHLDLLERTQLREALAAVTVTSQTQRRAFDDLFELYFPARKAAADDTPPVTDEPADETDPDDYLQDLLDELMEGGDEAVRRMARLAVDQFGRVEGRDGGVSYFQYKVFRAVDLQQLLRDMLGRAVDDEGQLTPLQERLYRDEFEARLRTFQQEVEAEIRRRAAAQRGLDQVADRMTRPPVEELDFFHLSAEDQAQLRAQIRPLARKLATRVSVKRRHGKDGRLDVRRTVRQSLATGGVPFDPKFKPRRPHKPELFLICDVSGSVASFARFTLMFVHALQEQFSKVRSFAFIDTLDEVTALFEQGDAADAMRRMMSEAELVWLDGHSDYGHSLERFHAEYARDLTPRSTVIILGDARNNYRQANAWVLQDLARRARRLYWLNPEPIQFWDTGDSISSSYARFVEDMVEVRNLKQLAAFVERIA
ncbi:VWA domain-containing protein [Egicoccus sp. AB-alg6-2]|uniref:vWA domain-containing protein n=1 Tax=Egicoccus sp. AB-alg6-2 TaxID=3242692 RepID=UPI00359D292E